MYHNARRSAPVLAATFAFAAVLARGWGLRTVALPAISCGIFGYPHDEAASVAMRVFAAHTRGLDRVVVMLADPSKLAVWRDAALQVGTPEAARVGAASGAKDRF